MLEDNPPGGGATLRGSDLPTTVSSALAESWSRVVLVMQVYTPASLSDTSAMVRLSDSRINLEEFAESSEKAPGHRE